MELVKIEIIIADTFLQELIELLEEMGIKGYTAFEIFRGKGKKRGEQLSEGLLPTSRNLLVFTVVTQEIINTYVTKIQEYLNERGGVLITYPVQYASGLTT
jgi:nitrogen regulatory protein PII